MPPAPRKDTGRIEAIARVMTRAEGDGDDSPTRLEIVAATDAPYRIWGVDEVLKMTKAAVDLTRLRNDAPFLADHWNSIDSILGRVEKPSVGNGELRVEVVLDDSDKAKEYARKVQAGMAGKISIGYRVEQWKQTRKSSDEEVAEFTATRWQPLEVSAVAVPADDAASVTGKRSYDMSDEVKTETKTAPPVDADAVREQERQRIREITLAGSNQAFAEFGARELAEEVIAQGGTIDDFRAKLAEKQTAAYKEKAEENKAAGHENGATGDGDLGLSEKDANKFSVVRAMLALHDGSVRGCEYELDVMQEAGEKVRKDNARVSRSAFSIPGEVFRARLADFAPAAVLRRALGADAGAGTNIVAENLLPGSFIDLLRAMSVVFQRASMLTGLEGDVDIPRQTSAATANWVADNPGADDPESDLGLDQISLSPKELAAHTGFTRKLLIQSSPDIELLVRRDFMRIFALAGDRAVFFGAGSATEPQGIFGTNGAAKASNRTATDLNWETAVELETLVNTGDALTGDLAYVTSPKGLGKAKTTPKTANADSIFVFDQGGINGYPVETTSQIPSTFASATKRTTGANTAMFFGNWANVIVGLWSGVDMVVDPYTSRKRRLIGVSAFQDMDIAHRHEESYSYMAGIT